MTELIINNKNKKEETQKDEKTLRKESLKKLLSDKTYLKIPKVEDIVKGKIISVSKNEIRLDIEGLTTGVIRGWEVYDESNEFSNLKVGDTVEATVLELENENGEMELSFRYAGHKRAWEKLAELQEKGEITSAQIVEANKGGLMAKIGQIIGFLPVSQLSPEHYPRISDGDKEKILQKLKKLVGKTLEVKIIDTQEQEEKLIVSEKAVWEEKQKGVITSLKPGDIVEGKISAITNFGAFIKFDHNKHSLEGLVHISEIAWQRIDHPKDIIKIGDKVRAKIISIEGSKIFLSVKRLIEDPWKKVKEKYKVGQAVQGKILKINPFGFFVELDKDIHGLAHISELSDKLVKDPNEIAKMGDVLRFKIVSIEPEDHRLGLSLRTLKEEKGGEFTKPEKGSQEK